MGPRPDALKAAIDEAWRVFDIPAPVDLGVCTFCCMAPVEAIKMVQTRAKDLTVAQINNWYGSAFASEPTKAQVAWLLPRVMEIIAEGGEIASFGNEVAFKRLPLSGFPQRWTQEEVRAVEAFAHAAFDAFVTKRITTEFLDFDGWLCMFSFSGIPLEPFLTRLDDLPDNLLFEHLRRGPFHPSRNTVNFTPFWLDSPQRNLVRGWYTSNAMLERLTRAINAGSEIAVELHDLIVATRTNDLT